MPTYVPNTQTPRIPTLADAVNQILGSWPHQYRPDIFTQTPLLETETGVPSGIPVINTPDNDEILPNTFGSNVIGLTDSDMYYNPQRGISTLAVLYRGMWSIYVHGYEDTPPNTIIAQRYTELCDVTGGSCRKQYAKNPYQNIPNPFMKVPPYVAGVNPLFGSGWAIFNWVLVGTMG